MTHEQRAREWMDTHANDITHAFQPGSTRIYSIVPEKALPSLAALLAEVEREARADERAACAKVADNEAALIHSVSFGKERHDYAEERARRIAAAIRARGVE